MTLGGFKAKFMNFEASEDTDPVAEEAGERVLRAQAAPKKKTGPVEMVCWR